MIPGKNVGCHIQVADDASSPGTGSIGSTWEGSCVQCLIYRTMRNGGSCMKLPHKKPLLYAGIIDEMLSRQIINT